MEKPKLKLIRRRLYPYLMEYIRCDWPRSIHLYYFLFVQNNWAKKKLPVTTKIYCLNGDPTDGIFVVTAEIQDENRSHYRVVVQSRIDEKETFRSILLESNIIDWSKNPVFESVFLEDVRLIREFCSLNNMHSSCEGLFYQVWLPTEKQEKYISNCPDDLYATYLEKEHLEVIKHSWRHETPETKEMLKSTLRFSFSIGLFRSPENKLLTWTSVQHFGGIGMLYTHPDECNKGYGKIAIEILSKILLEMDIEPFAYVKENFVSYLALFVYLGFSLVNKVTFINTRPTTNNFQMDIDETK